MKQNTMLYCDLKTWLREDSLMEPGKEYSGYIRRDLPDGDNGYDDWHFTFVESQPRRRVRRNVHLYEGNYVTLTLRPDGSLRLNFKTLPSGRNFDIAGYALGVCNEIRLALTCFLGKR